MAIKQNKTKEKVESLVRMWRNWNPSYTAGENVNGEALWKTVCWFLKELNIELPYHLTTVLWKKTEAQRPEHTCIPKSRQHD